jgi:membrane protease YdiL (CAAX protease family)
MAEKNANFPNGLEAFLLVVMLFIVEYLVGAALYDARGILSMEPRQLTGLIMVLANGLVFTLLMHYKGLTYRELFHASSSSVAATLVMLVPAIVMIIPALLIADTWLQELLVWLFPLSRWEEATFMEMASGSFAMVVYVCILAPVLEEMLFRGIILRSFLQQYSKWAAIVGSATLFGVAHMNLYQYVTALIIGLVLGWLYERTRSLLPCIALHAAYNTSVTLLDDAGNTREGIGISPSFYWVAALVFGVVGTLILRRCLIVPVRRK